MLSKPLDLDEALTSILQNIRSPNTTESVGLNAARGRVTARSVSAPTNLPPFPASAMDGYAFKWSEDIGALESVG